MKIMVVNEMAGKIEHLRKIRIECSKQRRNIKINTISKNTGVRWETVRNTLKILEECGVVKREKDNGVLTKKYMYIGYKEDILEGYVKLVYENNKLKNALKTLKELS